jgi:hypothetical protein
MATIRYDFKVAGKDKVDDALQAVHLAALDLLARVSTRRDDGHVRLFLGAQGLARRRVKRGWRKR